MVNKLSREQGSEAVAITNDRIYSREAVKAEPAVIPSVGWRLKSREYLISRFLEVTDHNDVAINHTTDRKNLHDQNGDEPRT